MKEGKQMNIRRMLFFAPFAVVAGLLFAAPAAAQDGEVALVIGALLGDDVDIATNEVTRGFDNSPLYGGRAGIYGHPWGFEGSVVFSPSGLADVEETGPGSNPFDVRVIYAEANVLLIPIPGPVSPFATGGIGIHSFKFDDLGIDVTENQLGFNFGGGIKGDLGPVGLRLDVRNHLTPFDPDDVDPVLIPILGLTDSKTLHNWEFSGGVSINF
jgi:hypothetical protein